MARNVTLTSLLAQVRQRADIENATARFPDAEVTEYINESIAELYDLLIGARGQEYYINSYSFGTTAGTVIYALPDDFYQLLGVDAALG